MLAISLLFLAQLAADPNVVVILADDMGYGDVRALNPESTIPTPNLDRLAAEGMTFADAHTPSGVCTPTRYGLLTGRYCWRSRLKRGVQNGYGEPLIENSRPTFATMLSAAGYHCGIVGKWHLGLGFVRHGDAIDYSRAVDHGPNDLGFAFSHVIPASLDFPPYVYLRDGRPTTATMLEQPQQRFPAFLRKGPRAEDLSMAECLHDLLGEAVGFIERAAKRDDPFLLYFPLTAPHKPVLPHPDFAGTTELGPYGDFVTQVDWTVGRVLAALERAEVVDDTLVIYTSDNGSFMYSREGEDHVDDASIQSYRPEHHRANGIYRGTKADIWEAGHRVPFFVRWPESIEAGSTSTATICLTDVLATLAEITGAALPEKAQDSFSFCAALAGETHDRPPVIHHSANGMFAIRDGDWKLVLGNGSGGREQPRGKPFARPFQLFDLAKDPSEAHDVIEESPEVAGRLEAAAIEICGADFAGARK